METDILTLEQKRKWKKNGYLILRNVLSQQEIKNLTMVVDQMYQEYLQQSEVKPNAEFDRRNVMEENDVFIPLMDHPVTFPIVLELMDPYILLGMSEVIVRPPNPESSGILHRTLKKTIKGILRLFRAVTIAHFQKEDSKMGHTFLKPFSCVYAQAMPLFFLTHYGTVSLPTSQ